VRDLYKALREIEKEGDDVAIITQPDNCAHPIATISRGASAVYLMVVPGRRRGDYTPFQEGEGQP
jgi:hypothetical protein